MKIGNLFTLIAGFICHNPVQGATQLSNNEQEILSTLKGNFEKLDSSNINYNTNERQLEWKLNEDEYKKLRSSLKGVFHDARLGMHLGIWYLQSNNITIPKEFTLITSFITNNGDVKTKFEYVDKPYSDSNNDKYINVSYDPETFPLGTQLGKVISESLKDYRKRIEGLVNGDLFGEHYHKEQVKTILNNKDLTEDEKENRILEYTSGHLKYLMFDLKKINYKEVKSNPIKEPESQTDKKDLFIDVTQGDKDTDPKVTFENGHVVYKSQSTKRYHQQGLTRFKFGILPKKKHYVCVPKKSGVSPQL